MDGAVPTGQDGGADAPAPVDCTPPDIPGATSLGTELSRVVALASDGTNVYALGTISGSFKQGLFTVPPAGGPAATLADAAIAQPYARVLLDGQRVLWSDDKGIHAVAKSGGAASDLVTATKQPWHMVLVGSTLLFTELQADGKVLFRQVPAGGGQATTFYTNPSSRPVFSSDGTYVYIGDVMDVQRVAVANGASSLFYSVQSTQEDSIQEAELRGSTLLLGGESSLRQMPAAGGTPTKLCDAAAVRKLSADATAAFWLEAANGNTSLLSPAKVLKSVPIAGGAPKQLVNDPWEITAYAYDDTHVYWASTKNLSCNTVLRRAPR